MCIMDTNTTTDAVDISEIHDAIIRVDTAFKAMETSGLSKRAIEVLIQDASGNLPLKDIRAVINAMRDLRKLYTIPGKPKA
jgi:hypothetical protein